MARITTEDLGPGKVLSYKKARLSKHHEHIIDVRAQIAVRVVPVT